MLFPAWLIRIEQFYGLKRIRTFENHTQAGRVLSAIRTDETGGQPFRAKLAELTTIMVREWQEIIPLESANSHEPLISIAIPRGGSPMGTGLKEIFPLSSHFESNDGINRDATRSLLPPDFPRRPIDHVVIADTVIGTGTTIERTIEAIKNLARVKYFHIFTAVASDYGLKQLFQKYPFGLRVCAGCVETKFEWVIKDGKPVLFVAGIGDAGDLVSR